jgi:hypothetical protein
MRFWLGQFFSDRKAHRLALSEVLVVCLISLIPLFALAVIDQLPLNEPNIGQLFWDALGAGQLYLYSFSLFGMLFWLCQKEHENFARFEPRVFFMFLIFVPCALILVIYATNPAMSKPLSIGFVRISFIVYLLYAVLYYILLVFDHLEPPPVEDGLRNAANSLINEYKQAKMNGGGAPTNGGA